MKKWFKIFLIGVTCSYTSKAQNYFNKNFDTGIGDALGSVIPTDSCYFIFGQNFSTYGKRTFVKIDLNGDTVFSRQYGVDSSRYYVGTGKCLLYKNQKFYLIGSRLDYTNGIYYPNLVIVNSNGDSLVMQDIPPYDSAVFQAGVFDRSGNLLLSGAVTLADGQQQVLLVKCDTVGNVIWSNLYGGFDDDQAYSIDTTTDNGYIMAGYTRSYGAGQWDVYIVKTDTSGNFQWHKWFGSTQDDVGKIKSLSNGQYLVCGGNYVNGFTNQKGFIRKINSVGNLIWHKNIINYGVNSTETFFTMEILPNGGTYLAGMLVDFSINGNNPVGYVLRTDSSGNESFHRIYTLSQNDNYINDIAVTPDGGFVCSGYLFPDGFGITTQDGWIFKADSMGCLVQNCWVGSEELMIKKEEWIIYPNPSNGEFTIEFSELPTEPYNIEIIDVTGKVVFAEKTSSKIILIRNPNLSSGLFVVRMNAPNRSYEKRIIVSR